MENNFGLTVNKTLKFYAESEEYFKKWYLDSPEYIAQGGTKEELEMVLGADILLDILSNHDSKIILKVSNVPFEGCLQLDLATSSEVQHLIEFSSTDDISGAFYYVDTINNKLYDDYIWLCDVTKYIFEGQFPLIIYYKIV